ncbi:MAG: rhamnogalacturonan acetylesterase [Lachnospiraceae bacterium]|nr:rhamnogalacturonan acetylesterase [Lachnospiraceae bacterium]
MKRILYAGDSTVKFNRFDSYPQTGISQGLLLYLKDDVFLRSFAENGRSTKSFIDEGRLQEIEKTIAEGDVFLIQFGHNDAKMDDPLRYTEAYGSFQENLKLMADVARKVGAWPVLITPVARRYFDKDGQFLGGSHGEYPKAMKELAERENVPCIDLNAISENYLECVGDLASRPMYVYPKDNTHLTYHGAAIYAGMIAREIKKLGEPYSGLLVL